MQNECNEYKDQQLRSGKKIRTNLFEKKRDAKIAENDNRIRGKSHQRQSILDKITSTIGEEAVDKGEKKRPNQNCKNSPKKSKKLMEFSDILDLKKSPRKDTTKAKSQHR